MPCGVGLKKKRRSRLAPSHLLQVSRLSPQGITPMPSITDSHSLFATSSAHCTMALTCAWVASFLRTWRCVGFTSFLKVPRRSADRQMGLGTHYPPGAHRGNELRCMTRSSRAPYLLVTAPCQPEGRQETSVSCLLVTMVQT